MYYCTNCGEEIVEGIDICAKCGHKQTNLEEEKSQISLIQKPKQVELNKKKKFHFSEDITDAIGCIIIVTGIVILIVLYFYFQELLVILWPYIIGIIVISWILRLLWAGICELFSRRKKEETKNWTS